MGPRTCLDNVEKRKMYCPCSSPDSSATQSILSCCTADWAIPAPGRLRDRRYYGRVVYMVRVGIVMGYGLGGRGSIPGRDNRFFSTPQHPAPAPSLLSNGYRRLYPWGVKRPGVELTTHLHLVPSSRIVELYLHSPIRLDGTVLNCLIS
jgi:hypothetical protein